MRPIEQMEGVSDDEEDDTNEARYYPSTPPDSPPPPHSLLEEAAELYTMDFVSPEAHEAKTQEILEIIDRKDFITDESDPATGETPLMIFIGMKSTDIALALIRSGRGNVGAIDKTGQTALMIACLHESNNIAEELIKTGDSNPSVVNRNSGVTALYIACSKNMAKVALELIKTGQSAPDIITRDNDTALTVACINRMDKVAVEILETGRASQSVITKTGNTALIIACSNRMKLVATKIVRTNNYSPYAVNNNGVSALIAACASEFKEIATIILQTGQSKPEQITNYNTTALIYACRYKMPQLALQLIQTGMSRPGEMTKQGNTALIYACYNNMANVALELINTGAANIGVSNLLGESALTWAQKNNMTDVIKLLKEKTTIPIVDINAKGVNIFDHDDDELTVKEFLNKSMYNIVFKFKNNYFYTDKLTIWRQMNSTSNTKYECYEVDNINDSNINYDVKYLNMASVIGLQILVYCDEILDILQGRFISKVFELIPSHQVKSIISLAYINGEYGASADHCQSGKTTEVYTMVSANTDCISSSEPPSTSSSMGTSGAVEPTNIVNIMFNNQTTPFPINDSTTIGQLKQMLIEEKNLQKPNQRTIVRFIYKGKVYKDDDNGKLVKDIDRFTYGDTIQAMVSYSPMGGKKRITRKRSKKINKKKSRKMVVK